MRLRALLLTAILVALLLAFPGVAISSATDYHASEASLRSLWTTDLAAGVPQSQLSPLQSELKAADAATLAGLPTIAFSPGRAPALVASLRTRTNAIYQSDLALSKADALLSLAQLRSALSPVPVSLSHLWREELDSASTPADYSALAQAWRLDTSLVPFDASLTSSRTSLASLVNQATSLGLATPAAQALLSDLNAYFNADPSSRLASAPTLQARLTAVTNALHSSINAALAARAAAAAAAAAKAQADAAAAAARAAQSHVRIRPPVAAPPPVHSLPPPGPPPGPKPPPAPTPSPTPSPAPGPPAPLALTLNGNYTDCTGATTLLGGLYRDTCLDPIIYLVSHKWSVGASFFALKVGSLLTLQGSTYTVYQVSVVTPAAEEAILNAHGAEPPLILQTCWTDSGSLLLIIDAH